MEKMSLWITIAAGIIALMSLFMVFQINSRLKRMKRRYDALLKGFGSVNIEELLLKHGEELENIRQKEKDWDGKLASLNTRFLSGLNKIAFIQYDAFPDAAGEKSYSLCMLDSYYNGIILTNLYGREYSVGYGKEVRKGNATVDLSPEEQTVLTRALNKF